MERKCKKTELRRTLNALSDKKNLVSRLLEWSNLRILGVGGNFNIGELKSLKPLEIVIENMDPEPFTVRKIVLKLFLYLYFRTILLKFRKATHHCF